VTGEAVCLHIRITGRVQGVAYRAWAQDQAEALGVSGWVRNRRDGNVEAVICGPPETVQAMIEACRVGPRLAQVDGVIVLGEVEPVAGPFTIAPTR
jgi:acylphosphatase